MPRKPKAKTVGSRLTTLERGVQLLNANDKSIMKEISDGFALMGNRLNEIYDHMDGFIKLHETLDIELRVMKEQMKRLEERVNHLETTGRSPH